MGDRDIDKETEISDNEKKRKRSEQSSVSDTDTHKKNTKDTTVKPKEKKKMKKVESEVNTLSDIKTELKAISETLSKVLTKDDPHLENIIKSTIQNMKEDLLKSVSERIEKLETRIFDKEVENDDLKTRVKTLEEKVAERDTAIETLKKEMKKSEASMLETFNIHEQYSRRNNMRINGIPKKATGTETAEETAQKVVDTVNKYMNKKGITINVGDIDVAHRIGTNGQIIARFVSRTTRTSILRNKRCTGDSGIYFGEDLTRRNQQVLMSMKKKRPTEIENAWTIEGPIKYKYHGADNIYTLKPEDYQTWLDMPWPAVPAVE